MSMLAAAVLMGLSIALLIWGGQSWLLARFDRDVAWVQDTALRFRPTPVDAPRLLLIGYGVMVCLLVLLIFITPQPLIGIGLWLVMLALPRIIVEVLWKKRRNQIDQQIPAAVSAMANSLKSGLTLVQAMQRMADNAPEPIRTDFRVMVNRYAIGANLEETIRETKARLNLANFNLFASALLINRELGGDVAETLFRISESLDKLHQMRKTVEAHTAEGRTNIKVLLIAPVVLLLMLATADFEGVSMLFNTVQGWAILLIAGIIIGTGAFLASWITNTEI